MTLILLNQWAPLSLIQYAKYYAEKNKDTQHAKSIRNTHKICTIKPKNQQVTLEDPGIMRTII